MLERSAAGFRKSGAFADTLIRQANRELHGPLVDRSSADAADGAGRRKVARRIGEARMIGQIERIGAELQGVALGDFKILHQADVDADLAGAKQNVARGVAEGVLRRSAERGGVEISRDGRIVNVGIADGIGARGEPTRQGRRVGDAERRTGSQAHDAAKIPATDELADVGRVAQCPVTAPDGNAVGARDVENFLTHTLSIAAVETCVVRVLRSADNRRVVERLGPCEVAHDVQTVRDAPVHLYLQLIGKGIAVGVEHRNVGPRLEGTPGLQRAGGLR